MAAVGVGRAPADGGADPAAADPPPRGRRWLRRLVLVGVAIGCLVVLDRLAAYAASRALASTVQSSQHLAARPQVTIRGFPFITQVLRGTYSEVDLTSRGPVGRNGVQVAAAAVRLHGVQVSVSDALHGTVKNIPVASGTGSAFLTYPELDAILRHYGGPLGSALTVTGTTPGHARLLGPLGLSLDFGATIINGKIVVRPDAAELAALPAPVGMLVSGALAAPIALPQIPFNVALTSGQLQPAGLALTAAAQHSVFPVR